MQATRALLAAGVLGPVLFASAFLVLGATRAGYDPVRTYVSQLSLGPDGWLQVANFILTGLLIVAAAVGLATTPAPTSLPASRWGPRLVGLAGLGFVVAGVFVTDPALGYPAGAPDGLTMQPSWHGGIHLIGAAFVFLGLPAAALVYARAFRRAGESGWAAASIVGGVGMLAVFIVANLAANGMALVGLAGLLQRASIAFGFSWLVAVSLRGLRVDLVTATPGLEPPRAMPG